MVKHDYRNFFSHPIPFFSDQIKIPIVVTLVLISAIISDMMISTFYGSLETQLAPALGIALFIGIVVAVYGIGQYFLLRFIKHVSISIRSKERQFDIMYKGMVVIQYVLSFIFLFLIVQILSTHQYYTTMIVSIITISFVPCIIIAGFLSYRFFLWYKLAENKRKSIVILLYHLAFSLVAIGAMARVIFYNGMLLAKPALVSSSSSSQLVVSGMTFSASPATTHLTEVMRVEISTIFYSADIPLILSFMFLWIATAMLLNHYSQKFGRIRYWTMICLPLIPFLAGMFPTLLGQLPTSTGFLEYKRSLLFYILIFKIAVVVGAILFSTAFFVMARNIRRKLDQSTTTIGADVKNYLLFCSYGTVILAVSLSSSEIHTPYPPFGVVAFSFAAL